MKQVIGWAKHNTSTLIGAGLMLSSSGLDGVYMALWMPARVPWLGFVLNAMADITDLYLGHRVGRLIRSRDPAKRIGAIFLFAGELIAVAYSWLFSWRQLLRILPAIEPVAYGWVAPLAAGFIPLLLAFLGIESGLTSLKSDLFTADEPEESQVQATVKLADPFKCSLCGRSFSSQAALNGHQSAHKADGNGHKLPESEPAAARSDQ